MKRILIKHNIILFSIGIIWAFLREIEISPWVKIFVIISVLVAVGFLFYELFHLIKDEEAKKKSRHSYLDNCRHNNHKPNHLNAV